MQNRDIQVKKGDVGEEEKGEIALISDSLGTYCREYTGGRALE